MSLCWQGIPKICRPGNAKQTGPNKNKAIRNERAISQAKLHQLTPVDIANRKLEFENMMRVICGDSV